MTDKFLADQISVYHNPGKKEDTHEAHTKKPESNKTYTYYIDGPISWGKTPDGVDIPDLSGDVFINGVASVARKVAEQNQGGLIPLSDAEKDALTDEMEKRVDDEWYSIRGIFKLDRAGVEVRMGCGAIKFGDPGTLCAADFGYKVFRKKEDDGFTEWHEIKDVWDIYYLAHLDAFMVGYDQSKIVTAVPTELFMIRDIRGGIMKPRFNPVEKKDAV